MEIKLENLGGALKITATQNGMLRTRDITTREEYDAFIAESAEIFNTDYEALQKEEQEKHKIKVNEIHHLYKEIESLLGLKR